MTDDPPVVEPVETPLLRIVKGDPTPHEVAALVAELRALGWLSSQSSVRKSVTS